MVRIALKRSFIGITPKQQLILRALGLKKIGSTVDKVDDKSTMGMINKVAHLVSFEKIDV
jgi:large subunit ribosomal protein L30